MGAIPNIKQGSMKIRFQIRNKYKGETTRGRDNGNKKGSIIKNKGLIKSGSEIRK